MCESQVLSTPLKSDLFLGSTDYCNPAEKHVQRPASPQRERVISSEDTRNNTNDGVAGGGHLEKLELMWPPVAVTLYSCKSRAVPPDPIFSKAGFSEGALPTNGVICISGLGPTCATLLPLNCALQENTRARRAQLPVRVSDFAQEEGAPSSSSTPPPIPSPTCSQGKGDSC